MRIYSPHNIRFGRNYHGGLFSSLQHVYGKGKGVGYIIIKGFLRASASASASAQEGGGVKKGTFVNRKDTFINRKHSAGDYGKEEKRFAPLQAMPIFSYTWELQFY
ncbi:hypothetical protein POVWA2_024550 [Plasmodium ovale wallikeri]|uniref:Uncharacterized protein n=1 Tax=Plasmodium ovale wallikeri TaxID=864142 RepID=A0A1A8YTT5_PLAOA|nr:hypothetical protein POVWA1_024690 [Plasmodium ovale wallikeri]SBT35338.1 hypothetical protein POVWA2_024550 [Plasmodium ovale wallikeri]